MIERMKLTQATAKREKTQCTCRIPAWSGLVIFNKLRRDELLGMTLKTGCIHHVLCNLGNAIAEGIQCSAGDSEGVVWVSVECMLIGADDSESGHEEVERDTGDGRE